MSGSLIRPVERPETIINAGTGYPDIHTDNVGTGYPDVHTETPTCQSIL
jgi:hypothetical protein